MPETIAWQNFSRLGVSLDGAIWVSLLESGVCIMAPVCQAVDSVIASNDVRGYALAANITRRHLTKVAAGERNCYVIESGNVAPNTRSLRFGARLAFVIVLCLRGRR